MTCMYVDSFLIVLNTTVKKVLNAPAEIRSKRPLSLVDEGSKNVTQS